MPNNLRAVGDARRALHGLAVEAARNASDPGVTGGDHSIILKKIIELAELTETLVEAIDGAASRSFNERKATDKLCMLTIRALQGIGKACDNANRTLCTQIIAVKTATAAHEKVLFPGNAVRIAVGEACAALYEATEGLDLAKYITREEFRDVLGDVAGILEDLARTLASERDATVAACHRCAPDRRATSRRAVKVADHLNKASLLATSARRLATQARETPLTPAQGRAHSVLGATA